MWGFVGTATDSLCQVAVPLVRTGNWEARGRGRVQLREAVRCGSRSFRACTRAWTVVGRRISLLRETVRRSSSEREISAWSAATPASTFWTVPRRSVWTAARCRSRPQTIRQIRSFALVRPRVLTILTSTRRPASPSARRQMRRSRTNPQRRVCSSARMAVCAGAGAATRPVRTGLWSSRGAAPRDAHWAIRRRARA